MSTGFKKPEHTLPYQQVFLPEFPNCLLFQSTKRVGSASMFRTGSSVLQKISGQTWVLPTSGTSQSLPALHRCYCIAYECKLQSIQLSLCSKIANGVQYSETRSLVRSGWIYESREKACFFILVTGKERARNVLF